MYVSSPGPPCELYHLHWRHLGPSSDQVESVDSPLGECWSQSNHNCDSDTIFPTNVAHPDIEATQPCDCGEGLMLVGITWWRRCNPSTSDLRLSSKTGGLSAISISLRVSSMSYSHCQPLSDFPVSFVLAHLSRKHLKVFSAGQLMAEYEVLYVNRSLIYVFLFKGKANVITSLSKSTKDWEHCRDGDIAEPS